MLTVPLVTVPEYRAHPTYLDTSRLRSGNPLQSAQDAALTNALLTASQWVEDFINQGITAQQRVERSRVFPDRLGRLLYHPDHSPVLSVEQLAIGTGPDDLQLVLDPSVWIEHAGRILVAQSPGAPGLAGLQFGAAPTSRAELLVEWTYTAGYPHAQLVTDATASANVITVTDATGITAGTVLRLWTPGAEEAVTVSSTAGGGVLVLSKPLAGSHPAGMSCSAIPATLRQAIILHATATLTRPAPGKEDNHPTGSIAPGSATRDPQVSTGGTGLIAQARSLLRNYQRIR